MAKPVSPGVLVTRLSLVTLVGAAVGWWLVVAFAFASMNNVTPSGSPEWWAAALDKLFFTASDAWAAWVLVAVLLTCAGIGARDLVALLRHITCRTAVGGGPAEPGAAADRGLLSDS